MAKKVKEVPIAKCWAGLTSRGRFLPELVTDKKSHAVWMSDDGDARPVLIIEDTPANRKRLGVKP